MSLAFADVSAKEISASKHGLGEFKKALQKNPREMIRSAAAFWGFSRGGFPENACIGGAISERNFCEICRRISPQNTEKHKTKFCAEVPERPLPKDPFFQLLIFLLCLRGPNWGLFCTGVSTINGH